MLVNFMEEFDIEEEPCNYVMEHKKDKQLKLEGNKNQNIEVNMECQIWHSKYGVPNAKGFKSIFFLKVHRYDSLLR